MAEIEQPADVHIGDWYFSCCECDLREIEDADDLAYVHKQMAEPYAIHVYRTHDEALAEATSP